MATKKTFSVAILGLSNHEERFIKIMLALTSHATASRTEGHYEWIADATLAHIVIVNADDESAMHKWHEVSINNPAASLLLITATDNAPYAKYFCVRPFGPGKVLNMLDRIVRESQLREVEPDVFSGAAASLQLDVDLTAPAVIPLRMRALVVDDSPTVRRKLLLELGNFNIRTDTAESGELGLEMVKEKFYDIIFLDVVLPGLDGYQICKSIRRNPETKNTPVIMLSSKSSRFDKVRGSLAGCNSYLTKPVDYEAFYRVLEDYIALPANVSESNHKLA